MGFDVNDFNFGTRPLHDVNVILTENQAQHEITTLQRCALAQLCLSASAVLAIEMLMYSRPIIILPCLHSLDFSKNTIYVLDGQEKGITKSACLCFKSRRGNCIYTPQVYIFVRLYLSNPLFVQRMLVFMFVFLTRFHPVFVCKTNELGK